MNQIKTAIINAEFVGRWYVLLFAGMAFTFILGAELAAYRQNVLIEKNVVCNLVNMDKNGDMNVMCQTHTGQSKMQVALIEDKYLFIKNSDINLVCNINGAKLVQNCTLP